VLWFCLLAVQKVGSGKMMASEGGNVMGFLTGDNEEKEISPHTRSNTNLQSPSLGSLLCF